MDVTLYLANEKASDELAQQLAFIIYPNTNHEDLPFQGARLYLKGDLGAGKTHFARAFLKALGVTGRIKSPTYTLLETYKVSRLNLYHFDFYRFNSTEEWQEAGFDEPLLEKAIVLVEWPEKAGDDLPAPDLYLHFEYAPVGRHVTLTSCTQKGQAWISMINSTLKI